MKELAEENKNNLRRKRKRFGSERPIKEEQRNVNNISFLENSRDLKKNRYHTSL
jgi:hypothetical protein